MRRIASFCLTIAALSATILTTGTLGALAAKPKQENLMGAAPATSPQGALATKSKHKNLTRKIPASGRQGVLAAKPKQESLTSTIPASGKKDALTAKSKQKSLTSKVVTARTQGALAANTKQDSLAKSESSSEVVTEAKRWIGTNPTGWDRVWCARFMNFVLKRTGHAQTGSDAASSFASYGRRVWGPQVGAIAVMSRGKNGGHVGVISGFDHSGNPIVISGNHNRCSGNSRGNGRCVGVAVYPRNRIYAYVMPR